MSMFNKSRSSVGTTGAGDTHFSGTVTNDIKKSVFNRDQIHKTTFNCGRLIPIYIDEVLPGDTMTIDLAYIARTLTPIHPTMDELELDFYFFFVPNRIVWDGWQALNGENDSSAWTPATTPDFVPGVENPNEVPVVVNEGTIADYYGIPKNYSFPATSVQLLNSLPFKGYFSIWNRWFRDQNLQAPEYFDIGSTPLFINQINADPLQVNKKHDYFTSCLPSASKGQVDTAVPATISVPFFMQSTVTLPNTAENIAKSILNAQTYTKPGASFQNNQNIVQTLRSASQLNKLLERDARSGSRYVEMLKAHFNVEAEDYRLQYPEFLGSHHTVINVSQVPQTSSTDAVTPQGNLSAFAMTAGMGKGFTKSFVEHGFIHGFVVARQRKTYQQGLEKFFQRRGRFDYFYPEFAQLPEQPVLESEIYATGNLADDTKIFGFQEAWADYRYKPNRVSGQFRSSATATLDMWHYADEYAGPVYLTDSFIKDNSQVNVDRTLAVTSAVNNQLLLDCKIMNKSARPMPVYSIPGLADHF